MNDLRYALRQLATHPGFSLVVIATLALGIGANTAIFSVIDGVLLRPVPFEHADRLAVVWETDRNSGTTREPASVPDYLDFQERAATLERIAAFAATVTVLSPPGGEPIRQATMFVSHEFLTLLGIRPVTGRLFTPDDDVPGAPPVVLLGQALWERQYGSDPDVVGRTIVIDEQPVTVAGVLPETAHFGMLQILDAAAYSRGFADRGEGGAVGIWMPLRPDPIASPRSTHPIFVLGRLAPGVGIGAAHGELASIAADLEAEYPNDNAGRGANVEAMTDIVFGPVRPALLVLLTGVGLVLLVACANVANLLLARGTTRLRDVAVRAALGAGAGRLARQFLVEGVVLALLGGAAGVVFALWATEMLLSLAPAAIPRLAGVSVNGTVLGVTLALSLVVGLVFGLVPTLQVGRVDLHSVLKGVGRAAADSRHGGGRLRSALVVAQLAVAVVLVVGAGLLVRSFWELRTVDPGFRADAVLKAEFVLPTGRYPTDFSRWPDFAEIHRFNADLVDRAEALPGVEAAALAGDHPLNPGFTNSFVVIGREAEAADWPEISVRRVTPGYFRTVDLDVREGRALAESDGTFDPAVAVINQSAARRFFPAGPPVGQQIAFWGAARTIVGVVEDEKFSGVAVPSPLAVYLPMAQAPSVNGAETLLLRTAASPSQLAASAVRVVRQVDPQLAVYGVEPLSQTLSRTVAQERFTVLLLGAFAALAVLLAVLGVHGVLSYVVARRAPEVGIRMALGAARGDVVGLIVGQGARLAALGLVLGLLGAAVASRLLQSLLFGIGALDPLTYVTVAALVFAVALLASWIPAHRATRIEPMDALRHE
jgi:predicted permease